MNQRTINIRKVIATGRSPATESFMLEQSKEQVWVGRNTLATELTREELHQLGSLCLDMANSETITELSMKIGNKNETIS